MTLIPVPTQQQLYDNMLAYAQEFVLRNTGQPLDVTSSDGVSIILEAVAASMNERFRLADTAARAMLPGPDSPHLNDWAALFGQMRLTGQTNAALWQMIQLASQQASLGSRDALRLLVLAQMGVYDVAFIEQTDGDFNTYLVASSVSDVEANVGGPAPGLPGSALNARIGALLNDGSRAHLGKDFDLVTPTAVRYGIYSTIRYSGEDRPDTMAFRSEVEAILTDWVIRNRWLGRAVSLSTLCLTGAEVNGLTYHETGLYSGAATAGVGAQILNVGGNFTRYLACNALVNVVNAQSEAMPNRINIRYLSS